MLTTTNWGLPTFVDSDSCDPLQAPLNVITSETERAMNRLRLGAEPSVRDLAERVALYPNPVRGDRVFRTDYLFTEIFDGSVWRGRWHSEFTGSSWVPASTSWGPGPLYVDQVASHAGTNIISTANDTVTLPTAGVYAVTCRAVLSNAAAGLTYISMRNLGGGVEYASFDITPGNNAGMLSIPNFRVAESSVISFAFRGAVAAQWDSRIRVTLMGA